MFEDANFIFKLVYKELKADNYNMTYKSSQKHFLLQAIVGLGFSDKLKKNYYVFKNWHTLYFKKN